MSTKIQIKRSSTASSSPISADLEIGELAINVTDKILYSKDSGGTIFTVASGDNTYTLPTASTTVLGGIKVGTNLTISNGVLSSTDTDTTYTGTGLISINGSNVISTTANNYTHPSGDGNLHVPATSTSNDGKVLTAGSTAGSLSWTTPASTYTLPTASSSALGGIKIGYTESGKNYPVELSSGKAFVNVPWSGGNYVSSTTAPASPVNGDHWFDSAEGILYLRLDSNWVDVTTASAASGGGSSMGGTMTSHIIPDTNDTYDIGSASYKIRDLYVSDNSLWVGDNHKITTTGGKKKTKKRKTGKTPKKIYDTLIGVGKLFDTETELKNKFKTDMHDPAPDPILDPGDPTFHPPIHKWLEFSIINGQSEFKRPEDIFDNDDDFADEVDGGGAMEFISKSTVTSSVSSVAITSISSSYKYFCLKLEATTSTNARIQVQFYDSGTLQTASGSYDVGLTTDGADNTWNNNAYIPLTQGQRTSTSGDLYINAQRGTSLRFEGLFSSSYANYYDVSALVGFTEVSTHSFTQFDGMHIYVSSGTIDAGTFTLYGIKDS
jgi:hypothetical protein